MNDNSKCVVTQCDRRVAIQGMCHTCYKGYLENNHKIPDKPVDHRRYVKPTKNCTVVGCSEVEHVSGLCTYCYRKWIRMGGIRSNKPTEPGRKSPHRQSKLCKVEGCGKPVVGKDLCNACYAWYKKHQVIPKDPPGSRGGAWKKLQPSSSSPMLQRLSTDS